MAAIPRKTQLVFGGSLTPSGNVAAYASLAGGAAAYSNDPAVIQTAAWLQGLSAALIGNRSPALEDMNGVLLVLTQQLAYLLQAGVPEWDAGTTYFQKQLARLPGSNAICASRTDNNLNNNPATDTTNWTTNGVSSPAAAQMSTFQLVNVTGSGVKILFDTPYVNPTGAYNGSTARYTAPCTGAYFVSANLQVDNVTANAALLELSLRAVKNGSTVLIPSGDSVPNPSGSRWYPKLASMVNLNVGDTLEIQLEGNDSVNTGQIRVSNSDWSVRLS